MIMKAYDCCMGVLLFVIVALASLKLLVWLEVLP